MAETDKVFAGSVPANYDAHVVPLIFQPYAEDLARRISAIAPRSLLETAAGSGVVTRAVAPILPAGASYTATDLNPAMLEVAMSRQPAEPRISWQPVDAQSLPFADAAFDAVCCQFGAMFFPDRPGAFREARRVLKPGGRFLFNVWDKIEANVFAHDVTAALAQLFPADPPRFLARTPHGYHDKGLIHADLEAAGFSRIEIETVTRESRADSARGPAVAYCHGTPFRGEIESKGPGSLAIATDAAEAALLQKHGRGQIAAAIQAHVICAVA